MKYQIRFFKNRASWPDLAEVNEKLDIDDLIDVLENTDFDDWYRVDITRLGS